MEHPKHRAISDAIDDAVGDRSITRAELRDMLEDIGCVVDGILSGLDADDANDARKAKQE